MTSVKYHNVVDDSPETAVLVGLITPNQDERKTKEYLDELEFLAETAGAKTVKRFTQRLGGPNSVTYLGIGKLQEIRAYIQAEEDEEREISMVIFDDELSAKQLRNIENELKVKILDRTTLILRHRSSWHNTATCFRACNASGHTSSDRAAAVEAAAAKAL